jgi:hypothetical protein
MDSDSGARIQAEFGERSAKKDTEEAGAGFTAIFAALRNIASTMRKFTAIQVKVVIDLRICGVEGNRTLDLLNAIRKSFR